ncbi:methyltransferase domain-containing protein [Curvivirga aplysinae]|uniref:methyltransferase domain-containing protein n=1 Tax=Curvivirga aplysinae TaxID=2529852 RepID=UPI0012BC8D94|nr:methyltransferase domain-containing protein [Curvivirga aplysinae]MTI09591.1 methyltransferase domain-containing protein [Curvivirga aplysinae]
MASIELDLETAMDHYREGELDAAKAIYDEILKSHPDNQEALDWRGEIAIQQDEYEIASECLGRSKELYPQDFDENCKLGLAYYELSEAELAVDTLKEAIDLDADDLVSHSNLGKSLYDLYNAGLTIPHLKEKAQRIALDWVTKFPEQPDAAHMGAAVAGLPAPERANDAYVADVFNDFAPDFEDKLEELGYQAPKLLHQLLQDQLAPEGQKLSVLDAGCGTGLCGPLLRPWASKLHGVDLSPGMLEKASDKGDYDALDEAELTGFMNDHRMQYELVVAADVFCYFGDLEEIFAASHECLKSNGHLAFSLECKKVINYELHASGRYSHAEDYVLNCLRKTGFNLIRKEQAVLRWEYGNEVNGIIVLAQKA